MHILVCTDVPQPLIRPDFLLLDNLQTLLL